MFGLGKKKHEPVSSVASQLNDRLDEILQDMVREPDEMSKKRLKEIIETVKRSTAGDATARAEIERLFAVSPEGLITQEAKQLLALGIRAEYAEEAVATLVKAVKRYGSILHAK